MGPNQEIVHPHGDAVEHSNIGRVFTSSSTSIACCGGSAYPTSFSTEAPAEPLLPAVAM